MELGGYGVESMLWGTQERFLSRGQGLILEFPVPRVGTRSS